MYQTDTEYSGGDTYSTSAPISDTKDIALYQTIRYGNFLYNIPLANGNYNVTLKFAEIYWNAAGKRIFNVNMNGQQVIGNLDIFAQIGKNAAYDVTIPVSVTNGMLKIAFTSIVDNAEVNAIEITQQGGLTCIYSAPTVSITPASQNIMSGGSDTYTISVTNNDRGAACTSTTFSLMPSDTNWTNFNASIASPSSVTLAAGSSGTSILTVAAKAAQPSGSDSTTVTATASGAVGHYTAGESNAVKTTIGTTAIVTFALNAGGGQYTDTAGNVYQADMDYSYGSIASTSAGISGTTDPTLYQSLRYGNFYYNIPLANGNYYVTLKFAEIYWTAAGKRIFTVSMNGQQVISNLDIFAQVSKNAAYDVTIPVSVTNGMLNIAFTPVLDNAIVSAIEIAQPQPQPPSSTSFFVNAGGGQYTDTGGNIYKADTDYSGGATYTTTASIAGTSDMTLYQSLRYANFDGNFSYNIPIANGNYNVTLKFAEIYWTAAGKRIFNVSMQGQQVIRNLYVFAKVGTNTAYDVTTPVIVTNGMLNIAFTSVADNAVVSAIEVQ